MSWRRWIWNGIDAKLIDRIAVPDLNKERQRKGLEPVAHLVERMHTVADLSLTLFPSWFAKDQPDWPQPRHSGEFPLFDPHPEHELSDEIRQFLANGDAPTIFTSGTGHKHGSAYFSRALDAVTQLGRRAIFLTPFQKQLPTALPGEVLWQSYVPLRRLLVQAAAIVHHGDIRNHRRGLAIRNLLRRPVESAFLSWRSRLRGGPADPQTRSRPAQRQQRRQTLRP